MSETEPTPEPRNEWDSVRKPYRELTRACDICGYSLIGLKVGDQCPECGTRINTRVIVPKDSRLIRPLIAFAILTYSAMVVGFSMAMWGLHVALCCIVVADLLILKIRMQRRRTRISPSSIFAAQSVMYVLWPARLVLYLGFLSWLVDLIVR